MTRASLLPLLSFFALAALGCIEHRPIRNGLLDEHVYLTKNDLTDDNPKVADGNDTGWLFRTTVVKASSPNILGDYAFPGFQSDTHYVRFQFKEDRLEVVDGQRLQLDDPKNPNDDLANTAERVMFAFDGQHVDVKLRESLDGERTNFLEENTESPWQKRQTFRVDFEKSNLDPISSVAWFYGEQVKDCAHAIGATLVPDSFEWDQDDQYMSFVIEVSYELNLFNNSGGCWDMVNLASGVGSSTIQYRMSFYRPGAGKFPLQAIAEKDEVNKKYGAFQVLNVFRDSETGLLSARSLLQRWDPNRESPVVYYFQDGFPDRFKAMFDDIKAQTNDVLAQAGAKLRVDFREFDDGGIQRKPGDLRYSFINWNQDIDTTRGLLGYGPSSSDPRTGEELSANVNLYNVGLDYYRFLIEDFLSQNGAAKQADPSDPGKLWQDTECTPGDTVAVVDQSSRLKSTLFDEMRRVMDLPDATADSSETDKLLPAPTRGKDAFLADLHRTLGEYRYANPGANAYVNQPSSFPLDGYAGHHMNMYDQPFGARNTALSQRVLDDMLGSNYDTFPWFRYSALGVFAQATNSNLISNVELKDRIAIRRYETLDELTATYGADIITRATGPDNPEQRFTQDGEEYVYTFLADQGWYLVASRSRSPVSYQFMRDYNQSLNAGASGTLDDYGLKILLANYEYYNNFVGF